MSYTPKVNANTLTLYLGIAGTGRAVASSTTLDMVAFGTVYNPRPSIEFTPDDVGMPIAIVGGGPVDADMPPVYFVQGALFHTTIAAYVSPTQVTLAAAPNTSIFNSGFATVILYRPIQIAADFAQIPLAFQLNTSIAPGTNDTMQFSTFQDFANVPNEYVERFGPPLRGQPVYLTRLDADLGLIEEFGGYITRLTTYSQPGVDQPFAWGAQCSSWAALARRRQVPPANPQTFTGVAGDVVFRKVVLDYLQNDGVAVTTTTAPAITLACAVGANVGQLLDQIVTLLTTATTQWHWTTDAWRGFILSTRSAVSAPWDVSSGADLFSGSTPYQQSSEVSTDQVANNVYALGQNVLLNTLEATFSGNGTNTPLNTPLPIGAAPVITLNGGSPLAVGILGVDSGKKWYWSQDSTTITPDASNTPLASTDALLVTYLAAVPAVAQAPNVGSLQSLQAIEGSSANYDYALTVNGPILPADLLSLATTYETQYGDPAINNTLYTLRPGLQVGQLQAIDYPGAGIASGNYLISAIRLTIFQNVLLWNYTAFGGANIGDAITALTQFVNRQAPGGGGIVTPTVPITGAQTSVPQNYAIGLAGASGSPPLAFPQTVSKGDLLWVAQNSATTQPTDSQGNVYILAKAHGWGGGGFFPPAMSIWYTFASANGSVTVSLNVAWISIGVIKSVDPTNPIDATGGADTSGPTITVGQAGNVVVTAFGADNGGTNPTVTAPEVLTGFELGLTQGSIATAVASPGVGSFTSSLVANSARPAFVSVSFRSIQAQSPPPQTTPVIANAQGTVTHTAGPLTADLPVLGNGGADVDVGVAGQLVPAGGTTGQVLAKNSGADYDAGWQPAGGLSVTTKGDLQGFSTVPARVPVGADGLVLTADSTQALGLKWGPGGGGGGTVPTSGWSAVNGIQYNDFPTPNQLGFFILDSGSLNWRFVKRSLPAGIPYTWIVTVRGWNSTIPSGAQDFGIYLTDGTKLIGFEVLLLAGTVANGLRVERMNSVTSDNGTVAGPSSVTGGLVSLKIVNDGTHRTFYYYAAGAWVQFYQEATGAFLTETAVGVGGISVVGNAWAYWVSGEIVYWSLT